MSIQLEISPRIIPNIATLYNDTNRIFMEYIDNSLDSAESYFEESYNSYGKKISIILKIEGDNYKNGKVQIIDNCTGITNFTKVVRRIGSSDKQGQYTTNGQFGFGIYSFMAACEKLEIISKTEKNKALYLPINRDQFDATEQKDVRFPDPKNVDFKGETGTITTLSQFDKGMWKGIDIDTIKKEVEKHFELLLSRENLELKIIDPSGSEYLCKSFDYSMYEGDVWEDVIDSLTTTSGRKKPKEVDFVLYNRPIKLFLKITKGKSENKNPVFIIKGRRIAEVREARSFKSNHKGDIWGHPNLTGYIDLGGFLEPNIARTDFDLKKENGTKAKAVFSKLFELEELILEFLKDINKKSDEKHYKELEDELNNALSKLAKIDNMSFRTELISGKSKKGILTDEFENIEVSGDSTEQTGNEGEKKFYEGEGKNNWIGDDEKQTDKGEEEQKEQESDNKPIEPENPFEDEKFSGEQKKKSGFNIEISDREPDIDGESNEPLRSNLIGGTIIIFRKHPDFVKRVDKKRTGESRISQRLVTYLSGEITVHYKDKFITREGQPDYNKKMFSSVVEFIYKFEELLSGLTGKNLGDISDAGYN